MHLTPSIQHTINTAARLHNGQVRKADGVPALVHPFSVAATLMPYTEDEELIMAALLHDVLEDVEGYSEEEMREEFGDRVTDIVKEVTETGNIPGMSREDKRASWRTRKESYLNALEQDSEEGMMICVADKLHNLRSTVNAAERDGLEAVAARFNSAFVDQLWFYGEVLRILTDRMGGPLVEQLGEVLETARDVLLEPEV